MRTGPLNNALWDVKKFCPKPGKTLDEPDRAPPLEIAEDMSDDATGIFAAIGALMAGSPAAWILRIVGGER